MLVVMLAGCVITSPVLQRVEIPIITRCVKMAQQRPAYEFDKLPVASTDSEIIQGLARVWPRGRKYESKLQAAIAGCTPFDASGAR